MDNPNKSPPKEEAYFGGSGLMDHICNSQRRKKGPQSHQTVQQMTADALTSSMISIPVRTVPRAKVMADDLVNFQSKPGSPNTLIAAIKGIGGKTSGMEGTGKDEVRHGRKQPQPPDATRALMEITGEFDKRKVETSRASGGKSSREQHGTLPVTVVVSDKSDFAPDIHQVIPSEPCYGLPLVAKDGGSSKLNYSEVVKVQDFQGIYYFELGCLQLGYTNSMPYDHPLDQQGHIASVLHSGTAAYSSSIGLIAPGIPITTRVESRDIHHQYFDIIGTIPGQDNHNTWGSLHFLPLVSNMFLPHYDSGTFLSHLTEGEYGFDIIDSNCIDMYQMYVVVPTVCIGISYVGVGTVYRCSSLHIGDIEDCTIFLKTFFTCCESSVNVAPSQAFFLRKRRELGPLCRPLPSWICIDTVTLCPGVVDQEGAQSRAIYSTQVLTFHMMLATNHCFEGIQEKAMVFIPFEFRDPRDTRSQWRVASFEYLDGVWEWVQVMSDHIASHYAMLAIHYATKPAGGTLKPCFNCHTTYQVFPDHRFAFCSNFQQGWSNSETKRFGLSCESRPWFS